MLRTRINKLEEIPIHDVWGKESQDFSKWLTSEVGLDLLRESTGVDLTEDTCKLKHRIGIVGVDELTGREVIVAHQLEPSDHGHLGKIVTYLACTTASIVIWISEKIREEHCQAIDTLNNITDDDFSFFALEIKLYKIRDSKPAPYLELICRPDIQ